ncbi:hypothetical protein C9374_000399 [Naegleria lovaniensis]|uniref:Ankyrin repeat domain-containing protein n=1 Tax=Naegleria lovaniensis TaxID=51637 RepID=A0AA88GST7_NAELO|nr:uncharacterized protein C9374_000399 [Naegleria lovaniensis]KAG2388235.1 hypothetical protein C9374_000399 [Naegleria lovaniensis]
MSTRSSNSNSSSGTARPKIGVKDEDFYPTSQWNAFKQTFSSLAKAATKKKKNKSGTLTAKSASALSKASSGNRASLPHALQAHHQPSSSSSSLEQQQEEYSTPTTPLTANASVVGGHYYTQSVSTGNLEGTFHRNLSISSIDEEVLSSTTTTSGGNSTPRGTGVLTGTSQNNNGGGVTLSVAPYDNNDVLSSTSSSSESGVVMLESPAGSQKSELQVILNSANSTTSFEDSPTVASITPSFVSNGENDAAAATPATTEDMYQDNEPANTAEDSMFASITELNQIKPAMMYHYVLYKFVKNPEYDDHTSSDKFEEFVTQYSEMCAKAKSEATEGMQEFYSWTDKEIRKLRDKEKPRSFLIHQAAKYDRSSLIFVLVSKYKCNIAAPDEFESSPLHWACSHRAAEAITILCQLKAKINVRDKYGKSPLQLLITRACQDEEIGDLESARKCFKAAKAMCSMFEGDYNFKTSDSSTVLHIACEFGRIETVKFLVSESAEASNSSSGMASSSQTGNKVLLNAKDKFGRTPIMRAAANGHLNIVEYILLNTNPAVVFGPTSRDDKKQNILHHAAVQGTDALINRLAFLNPSACASMMKEQDALGNTPLHLAVQNSNVKTVNLLMTLLHKDSMNVQNEKGETPLHLACKLKEKNIAEKLCGYLYQSGANPSTKDKTGQTPKQLATENDLQVSFVKKKK